MNVWGDGYGTNVPASQQAINTPPKTPINSGGSTAESGTNWANVITAAAAAALKLIPVVQALRQSDIVRAGQMVGTNTVTANNNGTITTRNPNTGQTSTSIPPVGAAYQTADGNIVTNNGNGTYTVVRPDGSRYTGNYSTNSTGALVGGATGGVSSFMADPANKPIIYGGLALAAILLLKGNK